MTDIEMKEWRLGIQILERQKVCEEIRVWIDKYPGSFSPTVNAAFNVMLEEIKTVSSLVR